MKTYDLAVIGHVSLDYNIDCRDLLTVQVGGAVVYSSAAAHALGRSVVALTKLAPADEDRLSVFTLPREDIVCLPSSRSTSIENKYFTEDKEKRRCVCLSQGDPFTPADIPGDISAGIWQLGGLIYGDFAEGLTDELARRGDCPDEVRRYIAGKAREIEQISTNIKRRNDTLTELAACIAEEQRDFFVRGRAALRPLRMKTVAEKLGLHESTISRAVSGKYLQCRWGVFSLGYFFTKGYSLEGGGAEIATQQVKEKLRAVIAREDRDKPYSDQKLSEILSVMGIEISRRTVAKYRDELGIADCRARKFTPLS